MRKKQLQKPSLDELASELNRVRHKQKYHRVLRSTVFSLVSVAAAAVLICVLLLPVLRIYGSSMEPTLHDGNIVLSLKGSRFRQGDLIAFYFNNKILVKRVIANAGDWINIDDLGNVTVNDVPLEEPYVKEKAFGDCNIELPYQVPADRFFVMGDHRLTSVDSRSTTIGCVAEEQVVGKIIFRVWPPDDIGWIGKGGGEN